MWLGNIGAEITPTTARKVPVFWEKEQYPVRIFLLIFILVALSLGLFSYSAALGSDPFGIVHFAGHLSQGRLTSDFPVYSWIKPDWKEGEAHFVLHGNYVASSAGLYCKYTIGFPLILAVFIRVLGPESVYYANVLVLLGLIGAHYGLARSCLKDLPQARFLALLCPLLLLLLIGKIWALALRPARDLSALTLLVAGCWLGIRGLAPKSRVSWFSLSAGSFFLGLAASVRLPNILVAVPAGFYLLTGLRFRGWKKAVGIIVLAGICFSLGVVPALYQNREATGNPLKPPRPEIVDRNPLQVEGEVTPPPLWLGFFKTTAPETFRYFWRVYGPLFFTLILLGLFATWKIRPIRWFCLGVPLIFVLFYSMWVHLMIRYMMIAHPFLLVLAMAGAGRLLWRSPRWFLYLGPCLVALDWWVRGRLRYAYGLEGMDIYVLIFGAVLWLMAVWRCRREGLMSRYLILALAVLVMFFIRYLPGARIASSRFQLHQARQLGRDIQALTKPGSVILATKPISQFITLFSARYGLRPFEMARLGVDTRIGIEEIRARGHQVYLLESSGWKRDAAKAGHALLEYFDLVWVGELRGGDYNLGSRFGRPASSLWKIMPWSKREVIEKLPVSGKGPWLLSLNLRTFSGSGKLELNGQILSEDLKSGLNYFIVPADFAWGAPAELILRAESPLPSDLDARLAPVTEPWSIDGNAQPDFPAEFNQDGFSEARLRDTTLVRTWWNRPGKISIPTVIAADGELIAQFRLSSALGGPRPEGAGLKIIFNGHLVAELDLSNLSGWTRYRVRLPRPYISGPGGELELIPTTPEGHPPSAGEQRLGAYLFEEISIASLPRRLSFPWPAGIPSFLCFRVDALVGEGPDASPYLFMLDGHKIGQGESDGVQRIILPRGTGKEAFLEVFSRSLGRAVSLQPAYVLRGPEDVFEIKLGTARDWAFISAGFYGAETFDNKIPVRWMTDKAELIIPVFPGYCQKGEVVVKGLDLAPVAAGDRFLSVNLEENQLGRVLLKSGRREYRFPYRLTPGRPRLASLTMKVDTWRPADYSASKDSRRLGLMLDSISLECKEARP